MYRTNDRVLASILKLGLPLLLLLIAPNAFAQVGKIKAKLIDAKTGEPLMRGTVQIVETKQGALSKDDGVATIINVAPNNTYTVIAKYASYKSLTMKNVKVSSDITTELVFKLKADIADTVLITSDRIMVEKTNTQQGRRFDKSAVVNTPGRQDLNSIIQLTPGIVKDPNGGVSINGSNGTANSIRLNNVEITNISNGRSSALQNSLSKLAIAEIQVTTAGGDASKGGYTGGEVNSTTRSGSDQFDGQIHFRTEVAPLFGTSKNGYKQMPQGDNILEFLFEGPIAENVKYAFSSKGNTRKYDNIDHLDPVVNYGLGVIDPMGNNVGQFPNNEYYARSVEGKLSFNLGGVQLDADAAVAAETFEINRFGLNYSDAAQLPGSNAINNLYSLTGKTQIGDGLLEMVASYSTLDIDVGKYDQSKKVGLFNMASIYKPEDKYTIDENTHTIIEKPDGLYDIWTPVSRQIPDPANPANPLSLTGTGINPLTGHVEGGAYTFSTDNPYGLNNSFIKAGNIFGFQFYHQYSSQLSAKYTEQISAHLLNFGFEGALHTVSTFNNGLPWDLNPFYDSLTNHPMTLAVYAVDKMEFNDITFQPSVRFDVFNPDATVITNLYDPVQVNIVNNDTIKTFAVEKAPIQTQLSPRLGITYAVTDQTTFNFTYGWYFKQPRLDFVLSNSGGDLSKVLARGNQIIGNGSLKAESTKEINVGFSSQLSDVFMITIQGVYKDLRHHSGLELISSPTLALPYTYYTDDQYGNVRSIQLTVEKRMSNNFNLRVNYTYSAAKGTSASANDFYGRLINSNANSENAVLPLTPFYLDYDKPHVAQLIFNLVYGKGEGPAIAGSKLLQQLALNLTTDYQSGTPFTRENDRGQQSGEYNGDRHPDYFQTDASLTRTISLEDLFGETFKNMSIDLQLEITNLFNRTEALRYYARTGQGDDDGSSGVFTGVAEYYNDPTRPGSLDAFGKMLYNPRWDENHDGKVSHDEQQKAFTQLRSDRLAMHTRFQIPRRAYFNVSFKF